MQEIDPDEGVRVLVVDPDLAWRTGVAAALGASGFLAATCAGWEDLAAEVAALPPALVLMDQGPPGGPGLAACRELRRQGIAVILLGARRYHGDVVAGYEAGADSHVPRPVGVHELVARVRAVVRRLPPPRPRTAFTPGVVHVGSLVVDRTHRSVRVAEQPVYLSAKEFDLLDLFVVNAGHALGRDEIIRALGLATADGAAVDAYVRRLRAKLEVHDGVRRIVAVRGIGFRFTDDAERAVAALARAEAPQGASTAPATAGAEGER